MRIRCFILAHLSLLSACSAQDKEAKWEDLPRVSKPDLKIQWGMLPPDDSDKAHVEKFSDGPAEITQGRQIQLRVARRENASIRWI